jgi:hypothetical protein
MTLQERVIAALSPLVSLPLWGAARALNMEMFKFGERRTRPNRKGQLVEVGEYALHIQCPWRIVGPEGVIVGPEDRSYPEDEDADWTDFDSDGRSRCEARMEAWLSGYSATPLKVQRVEADSVGGFKTFLQHGFVLEAFPADSLRGEYSEHWRLFGPSNEGHFVVTGYGVQE